MPKYFEFKIAGYYLYFTARCTLACMHAHASEKGLQEKISAKFFIKSNGDTEVSRKGILNDREILKIRKFIKKNYKKMYELWSMHSDNSFYIGK